MDESTSRASEFIRENLLAVICFGLGLIFLVYGLIVLSGYQDKSSSVEFVASATDEKSPTVNKEDKMGKIVVDVAGAVKKPGVYRLSPKSRIEDALLAAGGLSSEADQAYIAKSVNLASVLSDGAKVYIPFKNESSVALSQGFDGQAFVSGATSGLINLNSASSKELEDLPGIGTVTAGKIIDSRPYSFVEELIKRKIVSQKVYTEIKEKVSVY